jgi:hypothetical protein
MMIMKRCAFSLIFGIIVQWFAAGMIMAQTMEIPVKNQFSLFAKILTYDRNFTNRSNKQIVLGIIYQRTFRSSSAAKDEIISILEVPEGNVLGEIPLRYELIDVSTVIDLRESIDRLNINIIYVTPLRAFSLDRISEITQSKKILTLTGVSQYAEEGLAVSIGIKNDRPQIIINLSSAKAEGADFSSNFLKLTRVIQ